MSAWQAQNHKRQHCALATASRTDPLTGCLNRRGFVERAVAQLEAIRRHGRSGAIVVLDVDNFKPVNDVFRHAAGDELLCWVTKTLEATVRPTDAVGRIGRDEFAVFLSDLDSKQAQASAVRIDEALQKRAPASLGLASFPEDALELEKLTRRADMRLYASRRARRHGAAAERCVQQCAVAPGVLVFEITETAILEDQKAAQTFVERLRALGCKVAPSTISGPATEP